MPLNYSYIKEQENSRVKVCFDCHQYHSVSVTDYNVIKSLHQFEINHRGHRTQIVNLRELKSGASNAPIYHSV